MNKFDKKVLDKKQINLASEVKSLKERMSALEKRVINNGGGWG